jgi:hypothetical protein
MPDGTINKTADLQVTNSHARGLRPLGCWDIGSNPARGMDVCLLCLYVVLSCVGRGLCDGLITRPEESYRVSNCV